MINFYTNLDKQSFSLYPDTGSTFTTSSGFEIELTHDYSQVSSSFQVTPVSRPNRLSDLLVFEVSGSSIPIYSGQYTSELYEGNVTRPIWGTTHRTFSSIKSKWSEPLLNDLVKISTDRAYVFGDDQTTYTKYSSNNEDGAYIIYNG
tara:strand:+ start:1425 stop:1865 length:441 start_codon:yes stop_codon:yes gene_type:complete